MLSLIRPYASPIICKDLGSLRTSLPFHRAVHWLNRGKVFVVALFELRVEIIFFETPHIWFVLSAIWHYLIPTSCIPVRFIYWNKWDNSELPRQRDTGVFSLLVTKSQLQKKTSVLMLEYRKKGQPGCFFPPWTASSQTVSSRLMVKWRTL